MTVIDSIWMACPCFEPSDPLPWSAWPGKYRPPLGRPYNGVCRANPNEPYKPGGELLVQGCNLGYARTRCERVPDSAADAARFALSPAGRVRWVSERNHLPVDCGTVERRSPTGQGDILDRQVEAYFEASQRSAGLLLQDRGADGEKSGEVN